VELLLGIIIGLAVVGIVSVPLLSEASASNLVPASGGLLPDLMAEKTAIYTAIRNLEFDHDVGNIDDDEFARLLRQHKAQAIELLRQIDSAKDRRPSGKGAKAAQRGGQPKPSGQVKQQTKQSVAREKKAATAGAAIFACPSCGRAYEKGDGFCAKCGTKLP
jgi:hypothetical protein